MSVQNCEWVRQPLPKILLNILLPRRLGLGPCLFSTPHLRQLQKMNLVAGEKEVLASELVRFLWSVSGDRFLPPIPASASAAGTLRAQLSPHLGQPPAGRAVHTPAASEGLTCRVSLRNPGSRLALSGSSRCAPHTSNAPLALSPGTGRRASHRVAPSLPGAFDDPTHTSKL